MRKDAPRSSTPSAYAAAPAWHTAALIGVIVAVSTTGLCLGARAVPAAPALSTGGRILALYLPVLLMQWGLVFYVSRAFRPRSVLLDLLGERASLGRSASRPSPLARAAVDGALGLALLVAIELGEIIAAAHLGARRSAAVSTILPHAPAERVVWAAVALSAGFCEEVVYRGYLQKQLTVFTGRPAAAVVLQAALFGFAHADQGGAAAVRLGLYGLLLGAVAFWRRSLVPGVVGHAGVDLLSGLLG